MHLPWTTIVLFSSALLACGDVAPNPVPTTSTGGGGSGGGSGGGGEAGSAPLALAPGEVAELGSNDGLFGERLATPNGDEEFVIVVASTDLATKGVSYAYSLTQDGAPLGAPSSVVDGCSLSTDPWSTAPLPDENPPSGAGPMLDEVRDIIVPKPGGSETIKAKAIAVGKSAVVWADTTAEHPAELDPEFVKEFAGAFEELILPRERTLFGIESDLDQDGHVHLVFSPLTYKTAVAFFSGCDLLDQPLCPKNNQGEYLYLTPPNAIDPPYNTSDAIKEILAHELSHMIHFNRKVLRHQKKTWDESSYLIEGIGGFAQDVSGYQAGNLYVTWAGLQDIDDFSLCDTLLDKTKYDTKRDGALRGGSYLFVRWLYDRAGGDEADAKGAVASKGGPAFLRALLDVPESTSAAIPALGKTTAEDVAMDFYTALAVSNRDEVGGAPPKNPCFAYLPAVEDPVTGRQRGANLFAKFHGQQMTGPTIQAAGAVDESLRAGGVEYVQLDAVEGAAELAFTLQIDPAALPRIRVARMR